MIIKFRPKKHFLHFSDILFTQSKWLFCIAAVIGVLFFFYVDRPFCLYINNHPTPLDKAADYIAYIFRPLHVLAITPILFLLNKSVTKNPRASYILYKLTFLLPCVYAASCALGYVIAKSTPLALIQKNIYGFAFFTSGASFTAFPSQGSALMGACTLAFCRLCPTMSKRLCIAGLFCSLSEPIIVRSFLSDAIVGYLFGMALCQMLYDTISANKHNL